MTRVPLCYISCGKPAGQPQKSREVVACMNVKV